MEDSEDFHEEPLRSRGCAPIEHTPWQDCAAGSRSRTRGQRAPQFVAAVITCLENVRKGQGRRGPAQHMPQFLWVLSSHHSKVCPACRDTHNAL